MLTRRFLILDFELTTLISFAVCARKCLEDTDHGKCKKGDDKCLCHDDDYQNKATKCVTKACHGEDLIKAAKAKAEVCKGLKRNVSGTFYHVSRSLDSPKSVCKSGQPPQARLPGREELPQCVSVSSSQYPKAETLTNIHLAECAHPCLEGNHFGCKEGDLHCLCHNKQYQDAAKSCILKKCHGEDLVKCAEAQKKTCDKVSLSSRS